MKVPHDRTAWLQGGEAVCRTPPLRPAQPRRIVLLGPPGIGKGTQAGLLGAALGACYLSTGEILRTLRHDALDGSSPTGRNVLDFSRTGSAEPDAVLQGVVNERGRCLTCAGGFILDGFPRTVRQAEALDRLLEANGLALDAVVLYDLPSALIIPRLLGRRLCPSCQRVYHVKTRPPLRAGQCDDCQVKLVQRTEDRLDTIRLIQGTYAMNPPRLIEYYRNNGRLVIVSARGTPEEIFIRTIDAFRHASAAQPAWTATPVPLPDAVRTGEY